MERLKLIKYMSVLVILLMVLIVITTFLISGCAGNKRCVEWKMVHNRQLCGPGYPLNSWCTKTKYECEKWVDKGITKDWD